jgi:hypothetical protein
MKASLIAHRMAWPARLGGSIFTISLRKDKNYITKVSFLKKEGLKFLVSVP